MYFTMSDIVHFVHFSNEVFWLSDFLVSSLCTSPLKISKHLWNEVVLGKRYLYNTWVEIWTYWWIISNCSRGVERREKVKTLGFSFLQFKLYFMTVFFRYKKDYSLCCLSVFIFVIRTQESALLYSIHQRIFSFRLRSLGQKVVQKLAWKQH